MILVTGATGFVGGHLCRILRERQMDFRAASRRSAPGCITTGPLSAGTDWGPALAGVDTVIHLAGRAHVLRETAADAEAAFRAVNVEGTLALAHQAAHAGIRRFVFVSSIKVNGEHTEPGRPFTPTDPPAPQDAYGRSKADAEAALVALAAQSGMELTVVRPPLVYGAGVGANFSLLMRWAGSGLPCPFGALDNRRSLVYVETLCDLLVRAAGHPAAAGEILMVSDDEDVSTRELFARLATLQGRRALALPVPVSLLRTIATLAGKRSMSDRLLSSLQVDIGQTKARLDWLPPYSLATGLQRTVTHARTPR
ncbi:UDP-glucose 4-epimerase [Rhizobium sp. RU35A]|uniref:NAD-dependent epimerase/dehydratase family protein n=1 Tax=Rhizobium sp. RU35A TaxID=1907414 RepID=UPI0009545F88|nr:NAD-dependent epimerase/dehydratase family protein [Rhizobium sp. RU35A]SIR21985.1 UDP-glucose 4-epimerase [Rhizobium sp. RU35A]